MGISWRAGLSLVLAFSQIAWGQRVRDTNAHSWWVYSGDHQVSGPWRVFIEVQARRSDFAAGHQQFQSRNALAYTLSPNAQVSAGYVYTHTGRYGDFPLPRAFGEHRIYQQLTLKQAFRKLEFEHRYRNELRWLQNYTGQGDAYFWRYQNRFRYQIKAAYPLKGPWYVFGGDELLLPYGPNFGLSAFDQNRAFAGVGYKLNAFNKLEIGYMNQFLIQRNGRIEESNHTFRVQWISNMPFARRK